MQRIVRAFRAVLIGSAFAFFWSGGVVMAWTVFPLLGLLLREPITRRRACQRVQKQAFRLFHGYMSALRLLRLSVHEGAPRPEGAFVMVANHPTLVDVTALLSLHDDVCCVVKTGLVRNPLLGPLFRACGHIDGGDGEGMSGVSTIEAALARLGEGARLLVFPEGTRSPRGGMHRFRRGAFEIARRAGVPVVPIFLVCDPPALMKGMPFWENPASLATLHVEELAAIATSGTDESSRALGARVEEELRFRLERSAGVG